MLSVLLMALGAAALGSLSARLARRVGARRADSVASDALASAGLSLICSKR